MTSASERRESVRLRRARELSASVAVGRYRDFGESGADVVVLELDALVPAAFAGGEASLLPIDGRACVEAEDDRRFGARVELEDALTFTPLPCGAGPRSLPLAVGALDSGGDAREAWRECGLLAT